MGDNHISTYTSGYNLYPVEPITKGSIVKLCEELNKSYLGDVYQFLPEQINEGGIWCKYKKDSNSYKSMRLGFYHREFNLPKSKDKLAPRSVYVKWPEVNTDTVMEDWKNSQDVIMPILHKTEKITTFLKSFDGAPVWTYDELKVFENCFNMIGVVVKGKYPPKKNLIEKLI